MDSQAMFLNCPAYLDSDGAARCGLPAETAMRYIISSTDGPLESARIACPRGHHFNAPVGYLTMPEPLYQPACWHLRRLEGGGPASSGTADPPMN